MSSVKILTSDWMWTVTRLCCPTPPLDDVLEICYMANMISPNLPNVAAIQGPGNRETCFIL